MLTGQHKVVDATLPLALRTDIKLAPCSTKEIVEALGVLIVLENTESVAFL